MSSALPKNMARLLRQTGQRHISSQCVNQLLPESMKADLRRSAIEAHENLSEVGKTLAPRVGYDSGSYGSINRESWLAGIAGHNAAREATGGDFPTGGEGGFPIESNSGDLDPLFWVTMQKASGNFYGFNQTLDKAVINFAKENPGQKIPKTEIKTAQGAKPANGGLLPGKKNDEETSKLRRIHPGKDVASPNQIKDFQSVEEQDMWAIASAIKYGQYDEATGQTFPYFVRNKIAADPQFPYRILAAAKAGHEIHLTGKGGGTGSTKRFLQWGSVYNTLPAGVHARSVLNRNGFSKTPLILSGGLMSLRSQLFALMVADQIRLCTIPMVWMGCIYARTCDKSCPANLTTGTGDPKIAFNYVDGFFKHIQTLADLAEDIGYSGDKLPLSDLANYFLDPSDPYSRALLALDESDSESPDIEFNHQIIPPSMKEDYDSGLEQLNTGNSSITMNGGVDTVAYGTPLSFDDRVNSIALDEGGTHAGYVLPEGKQLTVDRVGDFAGHHAKGDIFVQESASRLASYAQFEGLFCCPHTDVEAGFRSSASIMVETVGANSFHFVGNGRVVIWGQADDYDHELVAADDVPLLRTDSIGTNPFANNSGAHIILPRKEWDRLNTQGHLQPETINTLSEKSLSEEDTNQLISDMEKYTQNLKNRLLVESLLNEVKKGALDPKDHFVKLVAA